MKRVKTAAAVLAVASMTIMLVMTGRPALGANGTVTTVAGGKTSGNQPDCADPQPAGSACLNLPVAIAFDDAGNLYISDNDNHQVRKVSGGTVTTFAGDGAGSFCGNGNPAPLSCMEFPLGIVASAAGDVYVADSNNDRVRKISGGIISTFVGAFTGCGSPHDGGPASPTDHTGTGVTYTATVLTDPAISYAANSLAGRHVTAGASRGTVLSNSGTTITVSAWTIGTPATGTPYTLDGACLNSPRGLALNAAGDLFISDALNNRVRRVDHTTNLISTYAGTGTTGFCGETVPTQATSACIYHPRGLKLNELRSSGAGVTYPANTVTDASKALGVNSLAGRTVTSGAHTGTVQSNTATVITLTVAGWTGGTPTDGSAYSVSGDLYIADESNDRIRRVATGTGIITTVAGNGTRGFGGDGLAATSALLDQPRGVAFDQSNNLYIADATNDRVRKVLAGADGTVNAGAAETISTYAGNGLDEFCGDTLAATSACLNAPDDVAFDASGNLYVADALNHRIRKVNTSGTISTFAGSSATCGDGGAATSACLNNPQGVARKGPADPLYIADTINHRIRVVDSSGNISTYAGTGNTTGAIGDGGPAASAHLFFPRGIALNAAGDLYIADSSNQRVRRIDHTVPHNITTVAGTGAIGFTGDGGLATAATLNFPRDVFVDAAGNLFIVDASNNAIRKVAAGTGIITTVAGASNGNSGDCTNGTNAISACLNDPHGVFVDAGGRMYIADTNNDKVKMVDGTNKFTTVAGDGFARTTGDGAAATVASVHEPSSVVVNAAGALLISSHAGDRVRKVVPGANAIVDGGAGETISTIVGTSTSGFCSDGFGATQACLLLPRAITLDTAGNLYVADDGNRRIREVGGPLSGVGGVSEAPDTASLPLAAGGGSGGRAWYALAASMALASAAAAGAGARRRRIAVRQRID
jgi:sugar lactone lactonase YvrE